MTRKIAITLKDSMRTFDDYEAAVREAGLALDYHGGVRQAAITEGLICYASSDSGLPPATAAFMAISEYNKRTD